MVEVRARGVDRSPRRALVRSLSFLLVLLLVAARAFAGSATLAWDPVASAALAGYMLHYGPTAGNYTAKIDVGNKTSATVSNLTEGATYHFVVTAYDASRTESGYSNDVGTTIPYAAPVAGFTASTTSGVAPLALNFTNTSTGTIATYAWTFGDGTTSASRSPSHVYASAGTYTVNLTVTGPGGSSAKTLANYVTVAAPVDTSPPTAPSSLTAAAGGTTGINLSWKASTDNVGVTGYRIERCQGAGCTAFAQIATSTGTTYGSTGLAANTSYSYRVRAVDAAGNVGAYSNTASATTANAGSDPSPPTVPSLLAAAASGSSGINLSWKAATDNVGVTGYRIERCQGAGCTAFTQIATSTATTFSSVGLAEGKSYSYRVRATDAAGNLSAYSNTATATTGNGAYSLVDHYYQAILGRAPDASGKAFWDNQIALMQALGVDVKEAYRVMAGYFFNSTEYLSSRTSNAQYVGDLYDAFLDRPPDATGLAYWTGQLAAGLPRDVVRYSFAFSSEFDNFMTGLLGDTASRAEVYVVVDFYRGALNRLPDATGFNFWVGQLRTAQCSGAATAVRAAVASIASEFFRSTEYANRNRSSAGYVSDLYYAFLRRGGDLTGVDYWINRLDSGAESRGALLGDFLNSPEFAVRVNAIIGQGCLRGA